MEEEIIMSELGFIIMQDGKVFTFGEYKPYSLRDKENPRHYHISSFKTEVANKEEWKKLKLPIEEDVDITANISFFASQGLIVGLNKTEGAFFASTPSILLAVPSVLTYEQLEVLMKEKNRLTKFDTQLSYIRVIDPDQFTIDRPRYMTEFYEEHVIPQCEELNPKRG